MVTGTTVVGLVFVVTGVGLLVLLREPIASRTNPRAGGSPCP